MNTNIIVIFILCSLSIVLDILEFEYSFVVRYIVIWYALCILVNYNLFI